MHLWFAIAEYYWPEVAEFLETERTNRETRRRRIKELKVAKRHAVKEAEREALRKTRRRRPASNASTGMYVLVYGYATIFATLAYLYLSR